MLTIQAQWGELEFIRPLVSAAEDDRRSALMEFALCRGKPSHLLECMVGQHQFNNRAQAQLWAVLRSWDDERLFLEHMQSVLQAGRQAVSGIRLIEAVSTVQSQSLNEDSHYALSRAFLGWPGNAFERASVVQALRDLAVAGLAVKRYALRHEGRYPDSLRDLVPDYLEALPPDWMDGRPLRYRLQEDERFALYSVGVDGVDDGGDPSPRDNAKMERLFLVGKDIV